MIYVWVFLAAAVVGLGGLRVYIRHDERRLTDAVILAYLADRPEGAHGLDILAGLGIGSGSLYMALARLEGRGSVQSWWGEPVGDAPRRRLYGLKPDAQARQRGKEPR